MACSQVEKSKGIKVFTYFKKMEVGMTDSISQEDLNNINNVICLKDFIANQ